MSYRLGLLDKSPVEPGHSHAEAVATSLAFAAAADRLGYHRLWLAEHHGSAGLAGPAPEVLVAHLLARTRQIRIGTGGVLLQHYSPYKVAEIFGLLASLAPGRVDLGIGKAPGGFPAGTRALQSEHGGAKRDFAGKLADLDAFLRHDLPEGHAHQAAQAFPKAPVLPERFLLGASLESAELAARLGWNFTFAGHFDGRPEVVRRTLDHYRALSGRRGSLAVAAVIAEDGAAARAEVEGFRFYRVTLADGHSVNLPDADAAREYARQWGPGDFTLEERRPSLIAGTGAEVRRALDALHRDFGVEEIILDIPTAARAPRLKALELLAEAALAEAA